MNLCPNPRLINPVPVKVIGGQYEGLIGWADAESDERGLRRFCAANGRNPYQYNAPEIFLKDIESIEDS